MVSGQERSYFDFILGITIRMRLIVISSFFFMQEESMEFRIMIQSAIVALALFFLVWNRLNAVESSVIKNFNYRFDSLARVYKQVPATLYDNVNKKCVLVYPDSVLYVRIKGEVK